MSSNFYMCNLTYICNVYNMNCLTRVSVQYYAAFMIVQSIWTTCMIWRLSHISLIDANL